MASTTASRKARGRLLQQFVRDSLLEHIYIPAGLTASDCVSTPMGVNGSDCQLSSHAKAVCDLDVECKNQETLNVVKIFWDHAKKREKNTSVKLLISKKNRTEPIVTLRWADFVSILKASLK